MAAMDDSHNLPPARELPCGCVIEDSYMVNGKQRNHVVRPCRVAKMIEECVQSKRVTRDAIKRHIEANTK
jgi:hypothetical protein